MSTVLSVIDASLHLTTEVDGMYAICIMTVPARDAIPAPHRTYNSHDRGALYSE